MDLANTQKPFIWRKKYEELGIEIDEKQIEEEYKRKAERNRIELQKIKERQQKRELEFQMRQSDNEMIQRMKEAEQHQHWEQQEDEFLLRQRRQKSKIRIRDNRAKPVDLFAHYIDIFGAKLKDNLTGQGYVQEEKIDLSDSPVELRNPCEWFNGLRLSDLEELEPGIVDYMRADCPENEPYWQDLLDITKSEMAKLQAAKKQEQATGVDIDPSVLDDIRSLLEGKSIEELDEMEREMEAMLCNNDPSIDESFYRSTLLRLKAHRAKMRLTREHKHNLKRQKIKMFDGTDTLKEETENASADDGKKSLAMGGARPPTDETELVQGLGVMSTEDTAEDEDDPPDGEGEDELEEDKPSDYFAETRRGCIEEYKLGGYSPRMLTMSDLDPDTVLVNFEEEYKLLEYQRSNVCKATSLGEAKLATMTSEEREFMTAASKGMDAAEATFGCEAPVRGADNRIQTYIWADKYQPRKPRYFNRVHTGFEWNKYNQTHYDIDNPPPKVVQGYKFNIFYPDLIDKSKAPRFTITPCKDDKDFCIIRFTAGPPYEDIAFKIVDREWNNTHKSGYRCQFINNMLQLWFQFKRYKYRR